MSRVSQDQAIPAEGDRLVRQAWSIVADAGTALLIATLTVALVAVLIGGAKLGPVLALSLASLLVAAMLFGPTHGLLAASAALVGYQTYMDRPISHLDLRSAQAALVAIILVGVAGIGLSSSLTRRGGSAAGPLLRSGRRASGGAPWLFFGFGASRSSRFSWSLTFEEARRGFIPFSIIGAGVAVGLLLRDRIGPSASMQAMLIAVLCVGAVFGARFGFAAGVFGGVLLNDIVVPATGSLLLHSSGAIVNLVVFAAAGWGVGALADRLQRQRAALEILVSASREIATTTDEGVIHNALFNSLLRLADRGSVQSNDDSGAIRLTSVGAKAGAAKADAAAPVEQEAGEGWRVRPLAADGRTVGAVRWRYWGLESDVRIADEIASSLIDLGASAIVRARLSVEKSEMEFVARTEHLRTILLDAVSHHFRSPLAGILGSVTSVLSLPERHDVGMRRELLLIIKEQANRLNRYVDNFLSVARLESGSIDVNLVDVVLEPLVYDVWESFGEAGGARRFLQVKIDPQPVKADLNLLTQVLGNVLENAIKFSPEESIVDVRGRLDGDMLILDVTDQGVGVQVGTEDMIFRRFFRSPGAKAPGLGLGLYITRSLLQMFGGAVEANNRTDRQTGLTVSITLPLAGAAG